MNTPRIVIIDSIEDTLIFGFDIDCGLAHSMAVRISETLESLDTDSQEE